MSPKIDNREIYEPQSRYFRKMPIGFLKIDMPQKQLLVAP